MANEAPKWGVKLRKRRERVGWGPWRVLYLLYDFALTGAGPAPALWGSHWALFTRSPVGGSAFAFTPSLVAQPQAEKTSTSFCWLVGVYGSETVPPGAAPPQAQRCSGPTPATSSPGQG